MTSTKSDARDWSATLFLPKTDFPMKAGLPQLEPKLLERWAKLGMYKRLRETAKGKPKFILHDGPPYANGNIHIGTALNKILKDIVTRSQQMLGFDSNYVPGWDCHGLPIEWQVEQEYRAKGKKKEDIPVLQIIDECRAFAQKWIDIQRAEFKRLGVEGDWDHPYMTMAPAAEAQIARELMKFAATAQLYRGSKPVMWSVVEKTALAEAEIEYHDYTSDTVWVKFPVVSPLAAVGEKGQTIKRAADLASASVVIWTTTPWTLPGNRAISFNSKIEYGLYKVTKAPEGNWAKQGDVIIIAKKLAEQVMKSAKVDVFELLETIPSNVLTDIVCAHPLRGKGYDFPVPLLDGDHVTDEDGTGFVHTAPGHGRDDFDIWMANQANLIARGIDPAIPFTVDADGAFTREAPGFEGKRVLKDNGDKGDANDAVIKALQEANALIARGRLKHQYPHSWRSKKPVIFRNTPQWFIAMDRPIAGDPSAGTLPSPLRGGSLAAGERGGAPQAPGVRLATPTPNPSPQGGGESRRDSIFGHTLRELALRAIRETQWVPASGQNRITGMIEAKPDWVLSRQRAWGVPIPIFVRDTADGGYEILKDERVNERIYAAFEAKGISAWHEPGAAERFLGNDYSAAEWKKVDDICDVWFDSASTHAFTLEDPKHFPQLAGIKRKRDGGSDTVMYLEGSDQHRGWFHSSLLESCGTRGRAPYDAVLTHGFVLDEKGQKMSKSLKNVVAPQDVIKGSGADILRLWVAASDYSDDLRIGPEILKTFIETYRKKRNTLRWMLGTLAHYESKQKVAVATMPELEQIMLHRLAELDGIIRKAYADYDYKRVVATLSHFMNTDLSAFYFDIRKDALYCEPLSSAKRKAALETIEHIFRCTCTWLAPFLSFTAEEAWLARYPSEDGSVHLETFPDIPANWRNDALDEEWEQIKRVRRVVTGALEIERANKRIGSSLEAAPQVYIQDDDLLAALEGIDFAEICITSGIEIVSGEAPEGAFTLPDVAGVAVVPKRATGTKCARSWRFTDDVGSDPDFPDLSARDAAAVREFDQRHPA